MSDAQEHDTHDSVTGHVSLQTYYTIYGALMVLLVVTVGAAYVEAGAFALAVAMAIAVTKAVLVVLYFMHVKVSDALVKTFSAAGFVFLVILLVITFADYLARGADWGSVG